MPISIQSIIEVVAAGTLTSGYLVPSVGPLANPVALKIETPSCAPSHTPYLFQTNRMSAVKSNPATATAATIAAPILYKPPTPAPLPADYEEFLASLNETERELMEIAARELKSSFFVQWCRGYHAWKKAKVAKSA
jgi:hypothetical protein